jgi:ribonuclease BN (tRNA processing enzyme)
MLHHHSMKLNVLGGCGAWPEAGKACSGFLVERDGYRLLLDVGYSHGHPDHCADLNPLLRACALGPTPPPPLPVYALPGALDAVLALDRPGMLEDVYQLHEFQPGNQLAIGPFSVRRRPRRRRPDVPERDHDRHERHER